MSSSDVVGFAELTGDRNPIHLAQHFAAKTPFKTRIAHGLYTASLISAVLGHPPSRTWSHLHLSDAELPCPGADWGHRARSGRSRRTDPSRHRARLACTCRVGGGSCPGWRGAHQSAVCCEQPTLTLARRLRLRVVEGHLTCCLPWDRRTETSQHHSLATACLAFACRFSCSLRSSS